MKTRRTFIRVFALALVLSLLWAQGPFSGAGLASPGLAQETAPEAALGTTFTYQGRLSQEGDPVSGTCDMTFRLYDQATNGTLVGSPIATPVQIDKGLFAASLDFGAAAFAGQARWLEIDVLCPGDAAATTLPRMNLSAVPYALHARTAPWSGLSGVPADIADGDANTTYQAGDGLNLDGTIFSLQDRVGDITAVRTGTGLLGEAESGDALIEADLAAIQARVSESCPEGQSIRVIKADGTVTCEVDNSVSLGAGNQLEKDGDILNVVEGKDSDLDADLLDGQQGTFYQNANNLNAGTLHTNLYSSFVDLEAEGYLGNANGDLAQNNGELQKNLNADLLDGLNSTYYLNASNIVSGTLGASHFSAWSDLGIEGRLGTAGGLAVNSGAVQPNLSADLLDGLQGSAYQQRVASLCPAGSSIRAIDADGTVTCETDDATTYLPGNQLELDGNILNVLEGEDSGLDADLLDGEQGDFYQNAANLTGTLDPARYSAFADLGAEGYLGNGNGDLAQNNGELQKNLNADLLDGLNSTYYLNASNVVSGTLDPSHFSAWSDLGIEGRLGTAGNLALNTGALQTNLNADLLDGLQGSAYQRRIINACGTDQAVGIVNEDGTVVCRNVGDGDISSVSAGTGLAGGGSVGDVTISADLAYLQRRVWGNCGENEAIRAVYADGSVLCQTAGAGDISSVSAGVGLSGGATSGDAILSANFEQVQARVSGTCASGISSISQLGTVTCAPAGASGDITAVYAGTGLTGGGTSGNVTLSASFAGSGSANTVARSDHTHNYDATYVNEGQGSSVTAAMLVDGATLSEIKDDDGSGSGLDADLLDGQHASYFARSGSGQVTNETSVTIAPGGAAQATSLGVTTSQGFCFLTTVQMDGIDEDGKSKCSVYVTGSNTWYLTGSHADSGNDATVVCGARCYKW